MEFIEWVESYSVNIKEIDDQHKKLIGIINRLHDAMKTGQSKNAISNALSDLIDYTDYHFRTEEELFQKYEYPDLVKHKEEHDDLTQKAIDLKTSFDEGRLMHNIEVILFLKDWLNTHILDTDKKYSTFLNSKGVD